MQISARSYLTAGITSAIAASAIAIAPPLPDTALRGVELPTSVVTEIALTGTSLPWQQIWTAVQGIGSGGLSGLAEVVFSAVGTEFASQAWPLVTAAATDVAKYLGGALAAALAPGALQIDFRGLLATAGAALGAGDLPTALQTLTGGVFAPVTAAVKNVFGPEFQTFLSTRVGSVLGALPELLRSAVQKVLGIDIKPATDALATALAGLLPKPPAAATAPSALTDVEATPTLVRDVPVLRGADVSAVAAPASAAALPGSAAAAPADEGALPSPVEVPDLKTDLPGADVPAIVAADPGTDAVPTAGGPRRGTAESSAAASPQQASRHRPGADSPGGRAGR